MKEIELTRGQVALVDDEDYEWLSQWKWYVSGKPLSFYAARGVAAGKGKRRLVYMHREIMKTPNNLLCDHVNHDTLDNQRHNLRNVTKSQNMMNGRGANKNNKLGVLGVSGNGYGFTACIMVNRERVYAPTRATVEEAIEDRRLLELEYHGEYASHLGGEP